MPSQQPPHGASMPTTEPIPMPNPAPAPSRSEVERKLSLRSASPQTTRDPMKKLPRRASNPPQPNTFTSPVGSVPSPAGGYESDSSYTSSQPIGFPPTSGTTVTTATPSLMTGASLREQGGLSAIAERDREGVIPLSDEDVEEAEEAEDEQSDEEEGIRGPEAGQLRKGVEGERVVKSGYLWKKGERRKNWKKRWFVLRTEKMAYYKDEKEYVLCRILDLRDIHTVASVQLKRHQFGFGIVTPTRTYYLKASSQAEMDSWIMAMNEVRRNLAEQDERARNPQTNHQQGGIATGVAGGPAGAQGKLPQLQIPRRDPAQSPQQHLQNPISIPAPLGSVIASPSRSIQSGGTPNSMPSIDAPFAKMGIAGGHSSSPVERAREIRERATSSQRDPSTSSVSSAGASAGPYAGQHDPSYFPHHEMMAITSSDEDDVYAPPTPTALTASSGFASTSPGPIPQSPAHIQTDPNKVILSGYLMKMGLKRKAWRKRWFVLTSGMLVYTKSHMDSKVHRQIPISVILDALEWEPPHAPVDDASDSGDARDPRPRLPFSVPGGGGGGAGSGGHHQILQHTFQVVTPKRTFKLCAPSEEDEIKWLAALRTLINREREASSPAVRRPSVPLLSGPRVADNESFGLRNVTSASAAVPTIQEFPPTPGLVDDQQQSWQAGNDSGTAYGSQTHHHSTPTQSSGEPSTSPASKHLSTSSQATIHAAIPPAEPSTTPTSPVPPVHSTATARPPAPSPQSHNHPQRRARSATQSAKAAVEVAVRRLHLGQQNPQQGSAQGQGQQQNGQAAQQGVTGA